MKVWLKNHVKRRILGRVRVISELIEKEFQARKDRNESYSLRAFSRDLAISPGYLSQILSSKKKLSDDKAYEICRKLNWNEDQSARFVNAARVDRIEDSEFKKQLLEKLKSENSDFYESVELKIQQFYAIKDWYHMAILELADLNAFQFDASWVAGRLGIDREQAGLALERLKNLKLLVENSEGHWEKAATHSVKDIPDSGIRSFHRQQLQKAYKALDEQSSGVRDITGNTMSVDASMLPQAKKMIRMFRQELAQLMDQGEKSSVYHLGVQFYQLDKKLETGDKK